jgi:hypothetical protein
LDFIFPRSTTLVVLTLNISFLKMLKDFKIKFSKDLFCKSKKSF